MNDTLNRLLEITKEFESRRAEMIDCLVVVKSRWDEIRAILFAESPTPVNGFYMGIPIILAESDVDASSKLIGSSYNRVMVVYSDRIMEANLKLLRDRAEADMHSWMRVQPQFTDINAPITFKLRCDS